MPLTRPTLLLSLLLAARAFAGEIPVNKWTPAGGARSGTVVYVMPLEPGSLQLTELK
jgi:hypothetical protein